MDGIWEQLNLGRKGINFHDTHDTHDTYDTHVLQEGRK